ncbi:MAG: hypothetical protein ABL857_03145 [Rickettsiales bacterium]
MSMMCKMNGKCTAKKGLCIHEKMMLGMVITIGLAGHFMFNWF